ncbi:MAG: F0F1 ATP synthase subunit B family protein [Rhodospirillales bacterium]|jgi:F-type H+-transporting ATPase subunit b
MPQLDISAFSPQIIWLVITFVILYVLMAKIALPRIGTVLEQRQSRIDDNLDAAQNLKNESDVDALTYDKLLSDARGHARTIIYEAIQEMSDLAARRQDELGKILSDEIKTAEGDIYAAKESAMSGIQDAATSVASEATERLIGLMPADDAVNRAILSSLAVTSEESH